MQNSLLRQHNTTNQNNYKYYVNVVYMSIDHKKKQTLTYGSHQNIYVPVSIKKFYVLWCLSCSFQEVRT